MLEKAIEAKLRAVVKIMGGKALKLTCPGTAGMPDRMLIFPEGRIYFIEVKKEGQKLKALQHIRLDWLNRMGFNARVISSLEQVDEFAKELMLT